jgi:hypothetical protein
MQSLERNNNYFQCFFFHFYIMCWNLSLLKQKKENNYKKYVNDFNWCYSTTTKRSFFLPSGNDKDWYSFFHIILKKCRAARQYSESWLAVRDSCTVRTFGQSWLIWARTLTTSNIYCPQNFLAEHAMGFWAISIWHCFPVKQKYLKATSVYSRNWKIGVIFPPLFKKRGRFSKSKGANINCQC